MNFVEKEGMVLANAQETTLEKMARSQKIFRAQEKSAAHSRAQSKNAAHKILARTLARVRFWRASSRVHQMVTHAGCAEQLELK